MMIILIHNKDEVIKTIRQLTANCQLPIAYFFSIRRNMFSRKVESFKQLTAYCLLLLAYFINLNATAQTLLRAEYFFNTDPGIGNATPITLSANTGNLVFTTNIPTGALPQGFHHLAIRVKETDGRWSNFESRGFYITATTSDAANITAAEYFFDTDPGMGSGTPIPVTPGATTNFTISVPTSSLAAGFHFLAIRTKGVDGKWGLFEGRGFYITSSTTDVPNLVAAEFFFDTDPGVGNGTAIPITPGASANFIASIPTGSLTHGFHFVAIRTKLPMESGGSLKVVDFISRVQQPMCLTLPMLNIFLIQIPDLAMVLQFQLLRVRSQTLPSVFRQLVLQLVFILLPSAPNELMAPGGFLKAAGSMFLDLRPT